MIKIALKHWIYEKCIDILFAALSKNFVKHGPESKRIEMLDIGDRFSVVVTSKGKYFNAVVREIFTPYPYEMLCRVFYISGIGYMRYKDGEYEPHLEEKYDYVHVHNEYLCPHDHSDKLISYTRA